MADVPTHYSWVPFHAGLASEPAAEPSESPCISRVSSTLTCKCTSTQLLAENEPHELFRDGELQGILSDDRQNHGIWIYTAVMLVSLVHIIIIVVKNTSNSFKGTLTIFIGDPSLSVSQLMGTVIWHHCLFLKCQSSVTKWPAIQIHLVLCAPVLRHLSLPVTVLEVVEQSGGEWPASDPSPRLTQIYSCCNYFWIAENYCSDMGKVCNDCVWDTGHFLSVFSVLKFLNFSKCFFPFPLMWCLFVLHVRFTALLIAQMCHWLLHGHDISSVPQLTPIKLSYGTSC